MNDVGSAGGRSKRTGWSARSKFGGSDDERSTIRTALADHAQIVNRIQQGTKSKIIADIELEHIISMRENLYLRAIRLYQLFIAMHFDRWVRKKGVSLNHPFNLVMSVPDRVLLTARLFAAMKLLESLSRIDPKQKKTKFSSEIIRNMIDEDFLSVYEVFARDDGWRNARGLPAPIIFQALVDQKTIELRNVAALLDFSLRTQKDELAPRQTGGVTSAFDVLTTYNQIHDLTGGDASKSTLIRHWQKHKNVSILAYLLCYQGNRPQMEPLPSKYFARRLLSYASDRNFFLRCIADYSSIHERLLKKNYQLPMIDVELEEQLPELELALASTPSDLVG